MAIVMAVVMVFSVVYINNRRGVVKAGDPEPDPIGPITLEDNSYLTKTMFVDEQEALKIGTYNVYVPIGESVNKYTFSLPTLANPVSESTDTTIYYIDSSIIASTTSPFFTVTDPGEVPDENVFTVREIKTTSLVWNDGTSDISSVTSTDPAGTNTANVKEKITHEYKLFKGGVECAADTFADQIAAFNAALNNNKIDPNYTIKSGSYTDKSITLNVTSRAASDISITTGTEGVVSVTDQDDTANNTTETTTNLYYGDVTYSYDGTNFLTINSANGFVDTFNSVADGEYTITKRIKSGDTLISEKTKAYTKNNQVLLDCYATVGTATTRYPENTNISDKIQVTSAAPNEDVFIHIVTDSACTITLPNSLEEGLTLTAVEGSPVITDGRYEYTYKLSATPTKNAGTTTSDYSFTVSDGTLSPTVTFNVTYTTSNPKVTEQVPLQYEYYEETPQKYYYGGTTTKANIRVTGSVDAGTITKFIVTKYNVDTDGSRLDTVAKTYEINPSSAGKTSDTVQAEVDLDAGINYFSCSVESSYGEVGTNASTPYTNIYLDNVNPIIAEVNQWQKFTVNSTTVDYSEDYKATESSPIESDSTVTYTKKITSKQAAKIRLKFTNNGGSSIKSVVETNGGNTTYVNGYYEYSIPAADTNNGQEKTYSFTITDYANNVSTVNVKVQFIDDVIEIKEYNIWQDGSIFEDPFLAITGKTFLKWKESELAKTAANRKFQIVYTVETGQDFELTNLTYDFTEDGTSKAAKNVTKNEKTYDDGTKKYVFNFFYEFDGTSREMENLVFEVSNPNESSDSSAITLLNIDSDSVATPDSAVKVDNIAADQTIWYPSPLVLNFTFSDDTGDSDKPFSGISKVTNFVGIKDKETTDVVTVDENGFSFTVKDTVAGESNTPVSFDVYDALDNKSKYSGSFKVDGEKPKTGLKIVDPDDDTVNLVSITDGASDTSVVSITKEPKILYAIIEEVSGVDSSTATINMYDNATDDTPSATMTLNAASTKLSDYFTVSDDKIYEVVVEVEDKAGNTNKTLKRFRVDGTPPTSSLAISASSKSIKNNGYYNGDVKLDVTAVDTNIKDATITLTDVVDSSSKTVSIDWNGTLASGSGSGTATITGQGKHTVTLSVVDPSGNSAGNKTVSFTIDTTQPSVTTLLDGSEYTKDNSYNKSVTTGISYTDANKDDNDITATIVRNIPGGGQTTTTKKGVGPHSITEDGKYTVKYTVTDKAGNTTITDPIGFTVDNTAPVHNLYVTTANPPKIDSFPNNYVNVVNKFTSHKNQESYQYGQYYNSDVTIEMNYFDYNLDWVYVTDNGEEISPTWTKSGAYGKATMTFTEGGYHDIQIWSKDLSGNERNDSGLGQRIRFVIDKYSPELTTYLNNSLYNEGSGIRYLNTNGSVNVSVSEGNKDTSDLTRYYKMTPPGGTAKTGEDKVDEGTETYTEEADYEVSYVAVDKAGNQSSTRHVYFRVDKTAPKLTVNGVGSSSNASSANVSFNVQESFYWDMNSCTVKIYKKVDGSGEVLEKTIDMNPTSNNYSQSYTFVDDAEYRIEFTAEDKCGNKSQTDYTFIKDGNAPSILLSGVKNYDKTDKNVELTITIEEAFYTSNRVTLSGTRTDIDGKSHKIDFDDFATNRTKISQLQQMFKEDGIYDITVTSTDKAGNSSSKTVHFTIDTTKPVIGDLSKYDGVKLNTFKWDVDLDELVKDLTVCDIKLYLDGALYDGTSDIEDGSHVLKVEATDELGHSSSKEVTFVLDSKAPNIIVMNVEEGDNLLESTDITVTVELDEDSLDTVTLNDKSIDIANNEGKITVNTKGDYVLNATAHDEAGNVSSVEIKFSYGKQTNLLFIGIIAGAAILLLLLLLVFLRRRSGYLYSR
jgi:hypothetical protein